MSDAFRDLLADVIHDEYDYTDLGLRPTTPEARCADAVLAMPEMQAIRQALYMSAWNAAAHAYPASPSARGGATPAQHDALVREYLAVNCRCPESVIAWVVRHE